MAIASVRPPKRKTPPFFVQSGRQWIPTTSRMSDAVTRYCGADRKLTTPLARLTRGIAFQLHRTGDATVLADAPEVDGHQERRDERDADAVKDVEPQQRPGADETAAQEPEACVVGRSEDRDVADLEQPRARPLDADQGRRRSHVRTDRDGPDGELIPGQQIAGEGEHERHHE